MLLSYSMEPATEEDQPKVLLVHGMRMQRYEEEGLRARWYQALIRGLRRTAWGRANPDYLPKESEVGLVYWADLFRPANRPEQRIATKGPGIDGVLASYYALLRGLVRAADTFSLWGPDGRPTGPVAMIVNRLVRQSAVYMNNGPVDNADPDCESGAFFQIQARFQRLLSPKTRVVIAHSLGTVVAYEGLCLREHSVDTFITVGSPIATPHLILEPMKERLHRLIRHSPDRPPPWPGVSRWVNYYASADVWSVPVKRLAPIFNPQILDVELRHGNPHQAVKTHKLTSYLEHSEIQNEIARALAASA